MDEREHPASRDDGGRVGRGAERGPRDDDADSVARRARSEWFRESCQTLHERFAPLTEGAPASYIPELARVEPDRFAIAAMTVDGERIAVGDCGHLFSIQSISKLLLYGLALETHGRDAVLSRVGVAPTGESFNAVELDHENTRAPNPMVNAGAIAISDLVPGDSLDERLGVVMRLFERYLGRQPEVDEDVWASERATGNRNRAIAYLMLSHGIISSRVEESLDLYFAQCSILVSTDDLARIGATLANDGRSPITGEQVVPRHLIRDLLTVALTCGMYDYAGEWAYSVGVPAKSGVGGGIMGIIRGAGGVAVFSPRLDEHGHSVRGLKVFEELSREFNMHLFDPDGLATTGVIES